MVGNIVFVCRSQIGDDAVYELRGMRHVQTASREEVERLCGRPSGVA